MKTLKIIAVLLFISQGLKAQIQFSFKDCFENWSQFVDAGNGVKVRAIYIKNAVTDGWKAQFMNANGKSITFNYTIYGGNTNLTKSIHLNPNAVSGVLDANIGLGLLYGVDIFITCSNFASLLKNYPGKPPTEYSVSESKNIRPSLTTLKITSNQSY